ncbi:BON domain-containing protein [Paraburkholderia caffeinilytica]|uniref:BON domain-containing protein n=1 Tax=Paraburkholderia caffeinilytica TaxID=1761016 RepID=A0ABQ1LLE1_9BURK|nr:BON domain-containing protein [Paraburkholderia caffeinilytica]GGC23923.1 hypothetical protein GCM10011400_07870 [Paraburkholderia caffeinilytica]CAB3776734.1 hypothetical protein LMG28690_00271 [Paraburkholderia caffeinilytica]
MNAAYVLKLVVGALAVIASVNGWSQTSEPGNPSRSTGIGPNTVRGTASAANRALRKQLYAALAKRSEIDAGSISITAKDGIVTVNGTVPDAEQLDEVTSIVKSVQGVVSVVNRLTIQRPLSQ